MRPNSRDLMLCLIIVSGVNESFGGESAAEALRDVGKSEEVPLVNLERQKRQLLFPIATLLQVSFCVATKVFLGKYSFFVNQGFQLNFGLPNSLSQIPWSFLGTPAVINGRSRSKRQQPKIVDDEITSEKLYYIISKLIDSYGYNGTECILHSICELAKVPFHSDEDLMHEVVHFIMTPSEHDMDVECDKCKDNNTTQGISPYNKYLQQPKFASFQEYLNAEIIGKSGADCNSVYKFCPSSPLDVMSEIVIENDDIQDQNEI